MPAIARKVATKKPIAAASKKVSAKKVTGPKSQKRAAAIVTKPVAAIPKPAAKFVPKAKLIRDSFTLPESDHDLLKACKKLAISSGRETRKSEVIRAAIQVFSKLSTAQQLAAYNALDAIAVGRPKAKH